MNRKRAAPKTRTTLTLPADSLRQAKKIAEARHVTLGTVISEVVSAGLQLEAEKERRQEILMNYREAFSGFSEEELAILDGVMLEPVASAERA